MNVKRKFWAGVDAFNREEWDDAKEAFEDLEGESDAPGAENLFEVMALLAAAYSRVHGDDFPDQTAYERAKYEAERALELLQDGLPDVVLGVRTHRLAAHLDRFLESVQLGAQPETFRFDIPRDEPSQFDPSTEG